MAAVAQQHAITEALLDLRDGAPGALDRLVPLVYADLARVAHRQLGLEEPGHTLSTTALVHEAYLRLVDQTRAQWADRVQFFAVAAHVMRRVLVDHARRHAATRRGGGRRRTVSLAALDARQARVVECRFFGGLTEDETADALGVTARTVRRDWVKARGWLFQELRDDAP
jgi:DNA-directed RNA polymerase specialized sigma24 family protein